MSKYVKPVDEVAVTTISVAELTHGAHRSIRQAENLAAVNVLLAAVTILPFDEQSARMFGELKAHLQLAGHPLDDLDLQIASIALTHDTPLVTHNLRHFRRVPGLALEDWLTID
ncbi:MAG TPA: type II toxin-antitoxin system VapC family toxin [Anaerolineae bacterium]